MRGSKAKRIRRAIYGEMASNAASRKYFMAPSGQIHCDRLRMLYQKVKKIKVP